MADRPWKAEERAVAHLLGASRYPANSGSRVNVEGPRVLAQVKHVQRLSLAQLEALGLEMAELGRQQGKVGLVVVKRRAGRGHKTARLVVITEAVWQRRLRPMVRNAASPQAQEGPLERLPAKQTGVRHEAGSGYGG